MCHHQSADRNECSYSRSHTWANGLWDDIVLIFSLCDSLFFLIRSSPLLSSHSHDFVFIDELHRCWAIEWKTESKRASERNVHKTQIAVFQVKRVIVREKVYIFFCNDMILKPDANVKVHNCSRYTYAQCFAIANDQIDLWTSRAHSCFFFVRSAVILFFCVLLALLLTVFCVQRLALFFFLLLLRHSFSSLFSRSLCFVLRSYVVFVISTVRCCFSYQFYFVIAYIYDVFGIFSSRFCHIGFAVIRLASDFVNLLLWCCCVSGFVSRLTGVYIIRLCCRKALYFDQYSLFTLNFRFFSSTSSLSFFSCLFFFPGFFVLFCVCVCALNCFTLWFQYLFMIIKYNYLHDDFRRMIKWWASASMIIKRFFFIFIEKCEE